MDLKLGQVRAFVVLAEELHFGRAAARLFVSQSHLSQQIRRLEDELGVRLLERTTRTVRLTEAGDVFLGRAPQLIVDAEAAITAVRSVGGGAGTIRLGATPVPRWSLLPRLAHEFRAAHPEVRLVTREGKMDDLIPALLEGELNAALILTPALRDELAYEPVRFEPAIVALPPGHPAAGAAEVSIASLRDEPILAFPSPMSGGFRAAIAAICRQAGFEPMFAEEELLHDEVLEVVREGAGVAILAQDTPGTRPPPPGVTLLPLAPRSTLPVVLCWPKGNTSKLTGLFVAFARELASREEWLAGPPPPWAPESLRLRPAQPDAVRRRLPADWRRALSRSARR